MAVGGCCVVPNGRLVLFVFLGVSLLLLGCVQPSAPAATPTPAAPTVAATAVATVAATVAAAATAQAPVAGGGASAGGAQEVKLAITHEGGYSPSTISVPTGSRVKILATSSPLAHKHGVAIEAYGINTEVTSDNAASPTVIEFTADKAGEFDIVCKTCAQGPIGPHPWHQGKLIVR